MSLTPISPLQAQGLIGNGAQLVDIRSAQEFAEGSAAGAHNQTLGMIERFAPGTEVIFLCRTGKRTAMNERELAALAASPAYRVEGGLEAWRAAGLPVAAAQQGRAVLQGMPLLFAGALSLFGLLLGWMYTDWWLLIPAFVAGDMAYAGATGSSVSAMAMARAKGLFGRIDPP